MAIVYWSARNVQHPLIPGNHHFVLIMDNSQMCIPFNIAPKTHKGVSFFTLAVFKDDLGNMVFGPNNPMDVNSVKQKIDNPGWFVPEPSWDFQGHIVKPPNGCNFIFAKQLLDLSDKFDKNSQATPLPFDTGNVNCSAWVNTLFKVAGVPKNERIIAGEFSGIDMGEEELIPENLFR